MELHILSRNKELSPFKKNQHLFFFFFFVEKWQASHTLNGETDVQTLIIAFDTNNFDIFVS
jgi:hypothetical protein